MSPPDLLLVMVALLPGLIHYLYKKLKSSSRAHPLPPGPKPIPILGNLFDMPAPGDYAALTQWREEYGDVVCVSALGKHMVILNSTQSANDLLHHRSGIYSDRPFIPMLHEPELMDQSWLFPFKPYSTTWKRHRRLFTQHFNPNAARAFFHRQLMSAHKLLKSLLDTPADLEAHIRHAAADIILGMTYGYDVKPTHDPFVNLAEQMAKSVGSGVIPSGFMVNLFPYLKHVPSWFPGGGFKLFATEARKVGHDLMQVPFEMLKRRMAEGTVPPSFVANALATISDSSLQSTKDIQEVAGTMYAAAADTTASSIHSCILGLVLNPSIQRRAQAELDATLGDPTSSSFRLPTFDDRPSLPYIDAIMKESLRWITAAASGIPHATTDEDVYRNWRIPKGSIVIANAWAMLHDEEKYKDPFVFRPERFLSSAGKEPEPDPGVSGAFGFGRRGCPGRHVGEATLWIQIASLLSVFDFTPPKDKEGRDIDISYAAVPSPALLLHPQPFQCSIIPRSKQVEVLIQSSVPDSI